MVGKVRVPWKVLVEDENSPFLEVGGSETFKDGEEESHIEIKIPQKPRDTIKDQFKIILLKPKPASCVIDESKPCHVTINNNITPAEVNLKERSLDVRQSDKRFPLTIVRSREMKGKFTVPWKLVPESTDSVYMNISSKKFIAFNHLLQTNLFNR